PTGGADPRACLWASFLRKSRPESAKGRDVAISVSVSSDQKALSYVKIRDIACLILNRTP
ncbi:MAG TPA: hypothetical protein PLG59_07485, partial [bacterium]|nr:hypothetical protein [bacterium]